MFVCMYTYIFSDKDLQIFRQQAAKLCNTLQPSEVLRPHMRALKALHNFSLKHTATRCNTLQYKIPGPWVPCFLRQTNCKTLHHNKQTNKIQATTPQCTDKQTARHYTTMYLSRERLACFLKQTHCNTLQHTIPAPWRLCTFLQKRQT